MTQGGNLPNGKYTKSDAVYVREWRRLAQRFITLTGRDDIACTKFDPGLLLVNKETGSVYADLSIEVINDLLKFHFDLIRSIP